VFVYVVGADSTVTARPVEVAASAGDLVVVGEGLAEGEQVVVDGQNQLRPGSKVAVREPARPRGEAAAR
jgi:multidrug efflux system membrane fusion protein